MDAYTMLPYQSDHSGKTLRKFGRAIALAKILGMF